MQRLLEVLGAIDYGEEKLEEERPLSDDALSEDLPEVRKNARATAANEFATGNRATSDTVEKSSQTRLTL